MTHFPFGSINFTGFQLQYAYGDMFGYLSDNGSTESQWDQSLPNEV